jgi:DNA invertase Pin-like site-specific DNA recombinase
MATSSQSAQPKTIRIWGYGRTSNDEYERSEFSSLDAQRECIAAYVTSQQGEGMVLVNHLEDGGISGATLDRPGLTRLLAAIKAGEVDAVICYKIDRISRSLRDFLDLIDLFDEFGVAFISVTQTINTQTSMGRLILNILLSFAQFEREMAGERIRDKVAATKRNGRYTGDPPVLGYDIDHDRKCLEVNPEEAALVEEIFSRFIRDGSPTRLAEQLNAEGMTTKTYTTKAGKRHPGRPWTKIHIYRVLHTRLYLGQVVHRGETYPGQHAALITQELWDQAHAILATNARTRANQTRAVTPALLKGLIRCGHCQASMGITFTKKANKKYRYYKCLHALKAGYGTCPVGAVPAGTIEEAVVVQLRGIFQSPELAATTYRSARQRALEAGMGAVDFSEHELVEALAAIDPIWEHLFPAEQARIVQLLVAQVTVHEDQLSVAYHVDGIHSLVSELRQLADEEHSHVA